MKTNIFSLFRKMANSGAFKAFLLAGGSVALLALLMTLATNLAFATPAIRGQHSFQVVNGHDNCTTALDADLFKIKRDVIAGKYFEDTRLNLSIELVDNYCLSSAYLKDLMQIFSFDRTRMDFAVYAINKVMDPENFGICKEAFAISANAIIIDDLLKEYQAKSK